jgi:soluble lytic murein transglycosylase
MWPSKPYKEVVARADELLSRGDARGALAALGPSSSPAAHLVRARAHRAVGDLDAADRALALAVRDEVLDDHTALERALGAVERGHRDSAVPALLGLAQSDHLSIARRAALPALDVLPPELLLAHAATLETALPPDDIDARTRWLAAWERAARELGHEELARALALRRYLEEPVSTLTPDAPPAGAEVTEAQRLARAEVLLEEHRNERALAALAQIRVADLSPEERCRLEFARGLAFRKLRRYRAADTALGKVVGECRDEELTRRALFIQTKVVSIRDGLRAVPLVEAFAGRFHGHTMVDDTLFWAGDLYQRRNRWAEAAAYFDRILHLPNKGDHCAEAAWRNAWMSFRRNQLTDAGQRLDAILADRDCTPERFERARASYWRARVFVEQKQRGLAQAGFESTRALDPLGYYGQLAIGYLEASEPRWSSPPEVAGMPVLCPGRLSYEPALERALELLARGLRSDAAEELRAIELPERELVGTHHAVALGVGAEPAESHEPGGITLKPCGAAAPHLLLALLLDEAGAHREAHWRLRTEFKDLLAAPPSPETISLWKAAYPLAHREQIELAERESGLPDLFLQALAREESALDPEVVSWAGAYGLTQLLLASGQRAGKLLSPPVVVATADDLLEPAVNARLGAALFASQVRKLGNNLALALAAYNAGDHVAMVWWKRHAGEPFDVFAEEMTIRETRGYVKRVLRTFGIYRWLYRGEPPVLPIEKTIPRRP